MWIRFQFRQTTNRQNKKKTAFERFWDVKLCIYARAGVYLFMFFSRFFILRKKRKYERSLQWRRLRRTCTTYALDWSVFPYSRLECEIIVFFLLSSFFPTRCCVWRAIYIRKHIHNTNIWQISYKTHRKFFIFENTHWKTPPKTRSYGRIIFNVILLSGDGRWSS